MATAKSEATLGKRLLIIAFGMSIVAIGLQPIKRHYGGFMAGLRNRTEALAAPLAEIRKLRDASAPVAGTAPVTKKLEIKAVDAPQVLDDKKRREKADEITKEDRKQLSKLLDDL